MIADVERPILDGQIEPEEIEQKLDDPKFATALTHIANWSASHCSNSG